MPVPILDSHNLESAERRLVKSALEIAGTIRDAAKLLGLTRHSLKRRMLKFGFTIEEKKSS